MVTNGRTEARVAEAVGQIRTTCTGSVSGIAADGGTREGTDRLIAEAGDAEILVNNLGIFDPKPFDQISDEECFVFSRSTL